jgi:hypothetical protein
MMETSLKAKSGLETRARVPEATAGGFIGPLLLFSAYLYLNLFALPHTPILLTGDQIYFWTDAQRMLFGELPYRDFFQFTPPGTDVVYLALFKLFGANIWVTNAAVLVLGAALCAICLSIAWRLMPRGPALLATFLFLTLVYGKLLNATHHWFSLLLILCAVRVGMTGTTWPRVVAAGIFLGAAALFTHTHAAVALLGFVLFFAWQTARAQRPLLRFLQRAAALVLIFTAVWLLCLLPFFSRVGIKTPFYYQFTFVRRYMTHTEGAFLGLPEVLTLRRLPQLAQYLVVYALVLFTYPFSLWQCWVRRRENPDRVWSGVVLLSLLGSLLGLEVAFSLSWLRVYVISLPAVVLGVFWLQRIEAARVIKVAWGAVIVLALLQTAAKFRRPYVVADLPAGRAALSPITAEKFAWIHQHTRPGEFFLEALQPGAYFPLGLRSPIYAEGLTALPQTRPEFVQLAIRQLDANQTSYILWSHHLNELPTEQTESSALAPFRTYLQEHNQVAQVFSDGDELWQKK